MGQRFHDGFAPIVDATPWIVELRGRGLMWAFEICHEGGVEPDKERTGAVMEACKAHGLLVGKGGLYGTVIRLSPMLNVTADEIDELLAALTSAVTDAA